MAARYWRKARKKLATSTFARGNKQHDDRLYDEKELEKSWLLSYSDLITLLFVIVIIIAATYTSNIQSQREEAKKEAVQQQAAMQQVHESLDLLNLQKLELQREVHQLEARQKALLGTAEEENTTESPSLPKPPTGAADKGERDMDTVRTQLSSALAELNLDYEETEEGLHIRLPESILFSSIILATEDTLIFIFLNNRLCHAERTLVRYRLTLWFYRCRSHFERKEMACLRYVNTLRFFSDTNGKGNQ